MPADISETPLVLDDDVSTLVVETEEDTYITIADVRAAGITSSPPTNMAIQNSIRLWQSFIERVTRQWFRPIELELYVDGTDSDALHFGVPIISISEMRLNGLTEALDPGRYRSYGTLADKHNPRIKLVDGYENERDIYTAPSRTGRSMFRRGRQNQYIRGVFGYVEADGSAPPLIKHALLKLVVEKLSSPVVPGSGGSDDLTPPIMRGIITNERTDGHEITYAQPNGSQTRARASGLSGITQDNEILDILRLFKAPIGLATPSNPSYR